MALTANAAAPLDPLCASVLVGVVPVPMVGVKLHVSAAAAEPFQYEFENERALAATFAPRK
jgi:hypothetical protein